MKRLLPFLLAVLLSPHPILPNPMDAPAGGPSFTDLQQRKILAMSPLPPPPADPTNKVHADPAAAHLGRFLFFDKRLSTSGELSFR